MKKLSEMTDEERYGKVGAEIRRLDPEAYKNRKDKSAVANMKLLRELRAKAKASEAPVTGRSVAFEESRDVIPARKETQADKDRRRPGSGAGFKNLLAKYGTTATRAKYRAQGYGSEDSVRGESAAMRRIREREESPAMRRIREQRMRSQGMKKGGAVHKMPDGTMMKGKSHKGYNKGGKIDGCAVRGKTRGRMR